MIARRDCLAAALAVPAAGLRPARAAVPLEPPPLWVYGLHVPPMIEAQPSGARGVVVDVVREAMRRSGRGVNVRVMPWPRAYEEVKSGRADGLIPAFATPARERDLVFCEQPVFISEQVLFFRGDVRPAWQGDVDRLHGLYGAKVRGVVVAPGFDAALAAGRLKCFEARDYLALARMLNEGRIDYAAMPRVIGQRVAEQLGFDLRPDGPVLGVQFGKLAFTRVGSAAAWKLPFDAALGAMWRSGAVADILARNGVRCDACLRQR